MQRAHQRFARFVEWRVDAKHGEHVAICFHLRAKTDLLRNETAIRGRRQAAFIGERRFLNLREKTFAAHQHPHERFGGKCAERRKTEIEMRQPLAHRVFQLNWIDDAGQHHARFARARFGERGKLLQIFLIDATMLGQIELTQVVIGQPEKFDR